MAIAPRLAVMELVMSRILRAVAFLAVANFVALHVAMAQSVDEKIAQAVLPLPEELRSEATVFEYDPDTGERIVLRQGGNHVECQPRNPDTGFTRCFPVSDAPRRDLSARLLAQGMSREELRDELAAAEADGRITPVPFGSLRYRLYDKDDRIQLLWVVSLPNATSEDLAMSTARQLARGPRSAVDDARRHTGGASDDTDQRHGFFEPGWGHFEGRH
jgi:hypothetical protein